MYSIEQDSKQRTAQHAYVIHSGDSSILVIQIIIRFFTREQSNRNDIFMRMSCCNVRLRQGHAGGVMAGMEQKMPAGTSVATSQLR